MSASVAVRHFAQLERWDPLEEGTEREFAGDAKLLRDIAHIRLGVQVPKKGSESEGVLRPYLRAANVRRGFVRTDDVKQMRLSASQAKDLALQPGDLLFVEGSGSVSEVGRVAAWRGPADEVVHQNSVVRARVFDDDFTTEFLLTWFNSRAGNAYIRSMATTTSGLYHIGAGKLGGAPVPCAPRPVQEMLVRDVDTAKADAVAAEDESRSLREAAWGTFQSALAYPASATSEESLTSVVRFEALDRWDTVAPGDDLASPYPLRTLESLGDLRLGTQVPKAGARVPGVPTRYLRAANVQKGRVDLSDVNTMLATDATRTRLKLGDGDLLVVEGNSEEEVGRAAVWRGAEDIIIQNSVIRVRLNVDEVLPEFVEAWLNCGAGRAFARRKATTTSGSLWHIGVKKLAGAPVPVPPDLGVQEQLVRALKRGLADADEAAQRAANLRERAEELVEDALLA